ncbi:MAG: sigma 54-interacting transcriptional regulator [Byssovorax sp.]
MNAPPSLRPFLDEHDKIVLTAVSRLVTENPFEPAWHDALRIAVGERYIPDDGAGLAPGGALAQNLARLNEPLGMRVFGALAAEHARAAPTDEEQAILQCSVLFTLWNELRAPFHQLLLTQRTAAPFYDGFTSQIGFLTGYLPTAVPDAAHLFAVLYQVYRALFFISTKIRGTAPAAAAARASIWRAALGNDLGAYVAGLYRRIDEIPVLITGETGTGKELAAECLAHARYIPFDPVKKQFERTHVAGFFVRNLCEVPRELMESSLFGHLRGSFTGATADARGCLGLPRQYEMLFLDEIGELPEPVQVKLLRPLQSREYLPIGETMPLKLQGRHLFATHRDLEALCREGRFRTDLYERIHGARVHMPPLRQMLAEDPASLRHYLRAFVAGTIDRAAHVERWTERAANAIEASLPGYAWPRNLRELKHFTERYILTGGKMPMPGAAPPGAVLPGAALPSAALSNVAHGASAPEIGASPESVCLPSSGILGPRAKEGNVSVEELTRAYVTRVHLLSEQNVSETARRTGLDRRTVQKWLDPARLARWLRGGR